MKMKTKVHKPGVNENYLMIRHLRLEGLKDENRDLIIAEIESLMGVDAVSITRQEKLLNVAYDASQRNLDEIEDILGRHECHVAHDWWTNFKEGWYKFTDQNARENATHEPQCCNRAPPGRK